MASMHQLPCTTHCCTAPFAPNRAQTHPQRQSASWKRLPARAGGEQDRPVQERNSQEELSASSRPKPNPEGLKLQKVERLGEESWAGVAAVDRGTDGAETSVGRTVLLVSGDLTALLLFAAIGRANHGESLDAVSVLKTAAPFLIGWFGAADLQKAFGTEAQGGEVGPAAKKAAAIWATGIPVGILVRTAQRGYLPDVSFVIVSAVVTFVFLVGWRTALAAATPKQEAVQGANKSRSKKGNPFEFLQLLASLTKRW